MIKIVSICPSMFYATMWLSSCTLERRNRSLTNWLKIGQFPQQFTDIWKKWNMSCWNTLFSNIIRNRNFFRYLQEKKRYALTNAARYYMNSYCALPCELWVHVCSGKKPSTVPQHIPNSRLSPEGGISFSRTQLSFSGSPCNGTCLLSSPGLPVHLPNSPGKGMEEIRNAMGPRHLEIWRKGHSEHMLTFASLFDWAPIISLAEGRFSSRRAASKSPFSLSSDIYCHLAYPCLMKAKQMHCVNTLNIVLIQCETIVGKECTIHKENTQSI